MTGRLRRCVTVALVAAVTAGCGVSAEHTPRPIDPPQGPFQALSSPTPAAAPSGQMVEKLFLVKDGGLVAVTRHVDREPTIDSLVSDLLNGPTDSERDIGVASALGGNVVSAVHLSDGLAVVDLATPIEGTGRNDEVLAYAQLVCTLTALPAVTGVTFTRDRQPIGVPRGDGSLSQDPLTTADYTGLIAGG